MGNISIKVDNCTFHNNKAFWAGAIKAEGPVQIKLNSTVLISNVATQIIDSAKWKTNHYRDLDNLGGALQLFKYVNITIVACLFSHNYANDGGGAIYTNEILQIMIMDSVFEYNSAVQGGAINAEVFVNVVITDTTFRNNSAKNCGVLDNTCHKVREGVGGAIAAAYDVTLSITASQFTGHKGVYGGVLVLLDNSTLFMHRSQIKHNHVIGTMIWSLHNKYAVISDTTFKHNTSPGGNQIYISGKTGSFPVLIMSNCYFGSNFALEYGAPIAIQNNVTCFIINSTFSANKGPGDGGVLFAFDSHIRFENCEFSHNNAGRGSVIAASCTKNITSRYCSVQFVGCRFKYNIARDGGVVYNGGTTLFISQCEFSHNKATNGAIVFSESGHVSITDSNFMHNAARIQGGVFNFFTLGKTQTVQIVNSIFQYNMAGVNGAVLYASYDAYIAIDSCRFLDNNANTDNALYLLKCPSIRTSYTNFISTANHSNEDTYIYFLNRIPIHTLYRTYETSFRIMNLSISSSDNMFWNRVKSSEMIRTENKLYGQYIRHIETPFATGTSFYLFHSNKYIVACHLYKGSWFSVA